jgi:peptidoglycan/LPS O-acetylase OafA/YrhL
MSETRVTAALPTISRPRTRYLSLDMWRGIACLAVVVFHSVQFGIAEHRPAASLDNIFGIVISVFGRLWIGVPLFFVISGYCISATADGSRRRGDKITTYFARRFRRIYPPFWASVLLFVPVVIVGEHWLGPRLTEEGIAAPWALSGAEWVGNLTLTESWRHHVTGGKVHYFMGQAWTLCYEEQFYLIIGLIVALRPNWFFSMSIVVTMATCGLLAYFGTDSAELNGWFFDGQWLLFAMGILVYWAINYGRRWRGAAVLVLVLVLLYAARSPRALAVGLGPSLDKNLFIASAFAIWLCLAHPWDEALATAKVLRPLQLLGLRCYSLYLIHGVVVRIIGLWLFDLGLKSDVETILVTVPVCVLASLAVSEPFYRLVERRFLNTNLASEKPVRHEALCLTRGSA